MCAILGRLGGLAVGWMSLFMLVGAVQAQWQHLPFASPEIRAFAADSARGRCLVAQQNAGLWRRESAGSAWLPAQTALIGEPATILDLCAVDAAAETLLAATWFPDAVMVSFDGGVTWIDRTPTGPGRFVPRQVAAWRADSRVWLALDYGYGRLARSTDHGTNWSLWDVVPSTNASTPRFYQDPFEDSTLWVTGSRNYDEWEPDSTLGIWRSTNLGETWQSTFPISPDLLPWGIVVEDVVHLANGELLAIATNYIQGMENPLFRSTNGGATWSPAEHMGLPSDMQPLRILEDPAAPGTLFLCDGDISSYVYEDGHGLYRSQNNGQTWARCENGLPALPTRASGLWYDVRRGAVTVSLGGFGLYETRDHGASWQALDLPLMGQWRDLRLAGGALWADNGRRIVFWDPPATQPIEITYPAAADTFITAAPIHATDSTLTIRLRKQSFVAPQEWDQFLLSRNGGQSWTPGPLDRTIDYIGTVRSGGQAVLAGLYFGNYPMLAVSHDGGLTWDTTALAFEPYHFMTSLVYGDETIYAIAKRGSVWTELHRTTNLGETWDSIGFIPADVLLNGAAAAAGGLFVLSAESLDSDSTRCWYWTDGGLEQRGLIGANHNWCSMPLFVPRSTDTLLVVLQQTATFWQSWNGGWSWEAREIELPYREQGAILRNPALYDVESGRIFVNSTVGVCYLDASTLDAPGPARFQPVGEFALSAYPNPFNSTTRLAYTLLRAGHVKLDLYDLLGRHVRSLVDAPLAAGAHEYRLDAASLPSGIYFSRLSVPGGERVQKIALLR